MKVKLIAGTQDPIDIMYTAARTCYSAKGPIQIHDTSCQKDIEDICKLVKQVLDSGHQSIAEHVSFTFAIEGISRACSHQLVRHRAGIVFSQQSQRYVEIKEDVDAIHEYLDNLLNGNMEVQETCISALKDICDKYFVDVCEDNISEYAHTLYWYLKKVKQGMKPEDARNFLPNATKTNIVMTVNFRELIHICNLRLCTRAQKEIRELFKLIVDELSEHYGNVIVDYLVPQCEVNGFCTEAKCCGRKPSIKEMKAVYEIFKQDTISKEDYEQLMDSIKNPKVNEKLKQLLEMKSVLEE